CLRELKHEVPGEPLGVPTDCLVEDLGRDVVQVGQVAIQQDLVTPDQQDGPFDMFDGYQDVFCHVLSHYTITGPFFSCARIAGSTAVSRSFSFLIVVLGRRTGWAYGAPTGSPPWPQRRGTGSATHQCTGIVDTRRYA